ncbi:glycosyltransferase [Leifsonia sp. NPDC058248]|uniref:glycosyltransferase n=1 Tax=Leifsonia sp. NPDC058248 TaxID=3346402 RepID=UPI0036DE55CB
MVEARTDVIVREFRSREGFESAEMLGRLATAPDVVIAIPVFNGGETVRDCIRSVVNHTHGRRILVIDDGSDDEATSRILDELAEAYPIEVIRNPGNLGYTRTANRAIELAGDSDVVLLNSDTEVGPLWIERLRWTAYSLNNVASVSAVSDNAGAMAMPVAGVANEWPAELSTTDVARTVSHAINTLSLEAPTGHGFCMYLRRDAIAAVGSFDVANFPRGYGEENDWCMRAVGAGMYNLVAPNVFVRHAQGVSFGESRQKLIAQAREVVDALHPSYRPLVGQWMASEPMADLRSKFATAQRDALTADIRPRIMYVIHSSGGGTSETNRDLMDGLLEVQESYLLVVSDRLVRFERWRGGSSVVLSEWRPREPFSLRDTWRPDYATFVADVIMKHAIELIHIRHLINQPLTTVPELARLMNVPFILSTHDFYYICPSVHLLDQNHTFCGGVCTPGEGPCTLPTPFTRGAPDLKHNWITEWKRRAHSVLDASRAVIATTPSAARIYAENYPTQAEKLTLIEHGRDLSMSWDVLREGRERRPGPLRIAAPATWDPHKGTAYVRRLVELTDGLVEWHIMGNGSNFVGDETVVHGRYTRSGMRELLDQIDPDFIGLLSIWPETYSHTLTEAWALGVPVVATDSGAVADRIRQHGGGELFPIDSPESAAAYILERAAELRRGELTHRAVPRRSIRSRLSMAQDYASLYDATRENLARPTVGYIVRGEAGLHTGSTHVRLRRRMRAAAAAGLRFRAVNVSDLLAGADRTAYDAMLVQRDAIPAEMVEEFLEYRRTQGIPLVVELDDDLLSPHARERLIEHGYDSDALDALGRLVADADEVIVSTEVLAERLRTEAARITITQNELDSKLWAPREETDEETAARAKVASVVYIGSTTHGEDLELLRPVFEGLTLPDGRSVRLSVIGVTTTDDEWYDRIPIPRGATQYPRFVSWLRSISSAWDLGVAPLADTGFNAAKSDLKFLEYSLLGLPTIASAVAPYEGLADVGLTLVSNDTDAWRAAIVSALSDRQASQERARTAEEFVRANRTIVNGGATAEWVSLLRRVATRTPADA